MDLSDYNPFFVSPFHFQSTLHAAAKTYVSRQADEELYVRLKAREFCYVLNSRQMGKSSLMVRVSKRLEADGVRCAILDFSSTQKAGTSAYWYGDLINELADGLALEINVREWKQQQDWLSPLGRLKHYLKTVVLAQIEEPVVIFIDEIDSVLGLDFSTDDLFTFIRGCHNDRVRKPIYQRLTFCLIGVADPADLIEDEQLTPFNIGRAIDLPPLDVEDAVAIWAPLFPEQIREIHDPVPIVRAVFAWTNGQPFLSQRVCGQLVEELMSTNSSNSSISGNTVKDWQEWVAQVVERRVLTHWEDNDRPVHLRTIRARLMKTLNKSSRVLELYKKVLSGNSTETGSYSEQLTLRLTGIVLKDEKQQRLRVFNAIYAQIFDQDWVQEKLNKFRPFAEALNAWTKIEGGDRTLLLRGKALDDALAWAKDRPLSQDEERFLSASKTNRLIVEEIGTPLDEKFTQLSKLQKSIMYWLVINQEAISIKELQEDIFQASLDSQEESRELSREHQVNEAVQFLHRIKLIERAEQGYYMLDNNVMEYVLDHYINIVVTELKSQKLGLFNQHALIKSYTKDSIRKAPIRMVLKPIAQKLTHLDELMAKTLRTIRQDSNLADGYAAGNVFNLLCHSKRNLSQFDFSHLTIRSADLTGFNLDNINFAHSHLIRPALTHQFGVVLAIAFSPIENLLAIGSSKGNIYLWCGESNQFVATLHGKSTNRALAFSSDGNILASGSDDGTVKLWSIKPGTPEGHSVISHNNALPIKELQGHTGAIRTLAFSPDGTMLVTGGLDHCALCWNMSDYQYTRIPLGLHQSSLRSIAFSPDGKLLAFARDGSSKIILRNTSPDMGKCEFLKELSGHQDKVLVITISPDGRLLASGGDDMTIRIWDIKTSECSG